MTERGGRPRQIALLALAISAMWCVANAYGRREIWLLVIPAIASVFAGSRRFPPQVAAAGRRAGDAVIALAMLYGFLWTSSLVYSGPIVILGPITAVAATVLGVLFLFGSRSWSPSRTALPAFLAAILSSCLIPQAPLAGPLAAVAVSLFFYAAATLAPLSHAAHQRRALVGQAFFALTVLAFAFGTALFLPWAQPFVERAVFARLSSRAATGFSLGGRLGQIESLSRSSRVVARVFAEQPMRLRLFVATSFNGCEWSGEPSTFVPLPAVTGAMDGRDDRNEWVPGRWYGIDDASIAGDLTVTRIISDLGVNDRHLSAAGIWRVRTVTESLRLDGGGVLRGGRTRLFETLSGPWSSRLTTDSLDGCLDVPEGLDSRITALARSLASVDQPVAARVESTLRYLERHYRYSREVGEFRTEQPLAEFLFEKKRGYCEYFASAAAILLRLQNVPTRYVRGFAVSEWNFRGNHYIVKESNAHAWIDVWNQRRGWVEFDPTPAGQYADVHAERVSWIGLAWERIVGEWAAFSAQFGAGDAGTRLRLILRIVVFVALPILVWLLLRFAGHRRPQAVTGAASRYRPEIARLIRDIDRALRRRGWPRPPTRAPLEHLRGIPSRGLSAECHAAVRAAIDSVYGEVFGGRTIDGETLSRLEHALIRKSR